MQSVVFLYYVCVFDPKRFVYSGVGWVVRLKPSLLFGWPRGCLLEYRIFESPWRSASLAIERFV